MTSIPGGPIEGSAHDGEDLVRIPVQPSTEVLTSIEHFRLFRGLNLPVDYRHVFYDSQGVECELCSDTYPAGLNSGCIDNRINSGSLWRHRMTDRIIRFSRATAREDRGQNHMISLSGSLHEAIFNHRK